MIITGNSGSGRMAGESSLATHLFENEILNRRVTPITDSLADLT